MGLAVLLTALEVKIQGLIEAQGEGHQVTVEQLEDLKDDVVGMRNEFDVPDEVK